MVSLAERRRGAEHLERTYSVSERRACRVVDVPRSTKRRPSGCSEARNLVTRIHELSRRFPRFGYRKIFQRLRREDGSLEGPTPFEFLELWEGQEQEAA